MTSYASSFGGNTVPPSQYQFAAYTIAANIAFLWPQLDSGTYLLAQITEINATIGGLTVSLPNATNASVGQNVLFKNTGANSFTVLDFQGNNVATIASGLAWYCYLENNSTTAGTWTVIQFGAGTSQAQASSLAGLGLQANTGLLQQNRPVTSSASSPITLTASSRAGVFIATGGSASANLPLSSIGGNGFFVGLINLGSGTLTPVPSGGDTLNGITALAPNESVDLYTDGAGKWYPVGYGRSTQFQFTKVNFTAMTSFGTGADPAGQHTMTTAEAANKLIQVSGTATQNLTLIVPNIVNIYYVQSAFAGAFSLTIKTAAGTGVALTNNVTAIVYCDGTNVVIAQTAAVSSTIQIIDGTAAIPAISFTTDGNTGIYKSTLHVLGISGNGTPVATFDSSAGTTLFAGLTVATGSQVISSGNLTLTSGNLTLTSGNATLTSGVLNEVQGTNVASAATTNLETMTGNYGHITGTTNITAITLSQGHERIVTFDGVLTLTNSANLLLPAGLNITTTIGDVAHFRGEAAGVVKCEVYQSNAPATAAPFVDSTALVKGSGDATKLLRFEVDGLTTGTTRVATMPDKDITFAGVGDLTSKIQSITSSVAANALTLNYNGGVLDFRNATLANGAPNANVAVAANSITIPSGATLGTANGVAARIALLEAYNGGSPVACAVNLAGGVQLDETNLISPTTISAGATSSSIIYSASSVGANSPYRLVGIFDISEATAGTWATDATLKQGIGGQALAALSSIGYGQTWQNVSGSRAVATTYTNTTGKPIQCLIALSASVINGNMTVTLNGTTVTTSTISNNGNPISASFIVPPGQTYSANITATATINTWMELR